MRAVVQRVSEATVVVGGERRSGIGPGLLILLGIEEGDIDSDVEWLCGKIHRMRLFPDEAGAMNVSLGECGGDAMVVSQFTLCASTRKGNRPSFVRAASPENALPLYEAFVRRLGSLHGKCVATGEFGAEMRVELVNDGPVTILVDSRRRE